MKPKPKKKAIINKDQLGLILGLMAIIVIVGFLFFINKSPEEALAGKAVFDAEPEELTVSCNANVLAEVNHLAVEKGCSISQN